MYTQQQIEVPPLTSIEISRLPWPKRCRWGIADKSTKELVHASDSEAWIKAEMKRRKILTDQFVTI